MKVALYTPHCPPEGYGENQPWFIPITDVPEETSSHAKARTPIPKPHAKAEAESPLILDARRRACKDKITNPIIENAKKRAAKAHAEVQNV